MPITFVTVLIGLFVAASGITLLQVAANPLIAAMGDPKGSHFRLNLSQAFNSMGAFAGGIFGAVFLLKGPLFDKAVTPTQAMKDQGLHFVTNVYLDIAVVFAVFTLAVFLVRNTIAAHSPKAPRTLNRRSRRCRRSGPTSVRSASSCMSALRSASSPA